MNILTDALPDRVEIGGRMVFIETDFRAGIAFEGMVENGEMRIGKLLSPFFPYGLPDAKYKDEAVDAVLTFYRCGETPREAQGGATKGKQAYSFAVDASTVYADFWRYYGIDLSGAVLHWWAFRALLMGLPDDSGFKQRVYYRTCDLAGMPKKERERINKIRKQIEIRPAGREKMTLAERNAQMLEYASRRSRQANEANAEP